MSRIENFSKFTSEGLASTGSKIRRIVTGQSAGDELEKLSNEQQQKLVDLYNQDPTEAAKYLRSIIIKEKNSQFGLGLALTLAGAGLIYKAINEPPVDPPNPPPPPPRPPVEDYIVQKGDSWWEIAEEHLPSGASNKDILAYAKQLASENGADHLYSGKFGNPGLKPDTWIDLVSGKEVGKDVLTASDKLVPDEVVNINPFMSGGKRYGL